MLNMQRSNTDINHTVRVVIADHNEADRNTVIGLLSAEDGFMVEGVSSLDELMALLAVRDVDCIIVDKILGDETGFVINDRVTAKYLDPPAMVMLTGTGDERIAMKAFRCGFSNYVRKQSLDSRELITAILHATSRRHVERMQRAELERLARMSLRDRITGMPNRQFLDDRLAVLIASGQRLAKSGRQGRGNRFAALTIDINAFRTINDRFGHAIGDRALKAFADKLKQVARASDVYGRLGGDEFLYLIENDASAESVDLACRRLVSALSFSIDLDAVGLDLSPSIGAAVYPTDGATASELLTAADMAMRAAKTTGNGYSLAVASQGLAVGNGRSKLNVALDPGMPGAANDSAPDPVYALVQPAAFESAVATLSPVALDSSEDHQGVHREADRREDRRQRVLKRGKILTQDGFSTIDCVIRDLSPRGARVVVEAECATQPRFALLIVDTGMRYDAERRWQKGREIGLMFVDSP